jgi:hypothetical protein
VDLAFDGAGGVGAMSLDELTTLVPPPKRPKEISPATRWRQAERELGSRLPADYRQFVHTYGTGLFAGLYCVHTPYCKDPYLNLVRYVEMVSEDLRSRDDVPFAVHPDWPGLLLWGHDENGNYYYWLTKGDPDRWQVVSENVRGDGFAVHKCPMVEYLLRVQKRKIRALASGYPPLIMHCPCETCPGWARGSHDAEGSWYCETCGSEWADRESFEDDVAEAIQKHPHRRSCYVRKSGHYYPATSEREPADYKKLVRKELDD